MVEGVFADGGDGETTESVGDEQFARVGAPEFGDGSLAAADGVVIGAFGGIGQEEKDSEKERENENEKTREHEDTETPRAGRVRTTRCVVSHGLTFRLEL